MYRIGLIIVLAALVGGCWDHVPIERVAFVSVMGIDVDPKVSDQLIITYTVVRPTALISDSESGGSVPQGGTPFYLVSSLEPGFQSSFSTQSQTIPRTLRFTHLTAIVISEEQARKGIDEIIAWAVRQPLVRTSVEIIVASGHAQVFLDTKPVLEPLPGDTLGDLIDTAVISGVSQKAPLYLFTRRLLSLRHDPVVPLAERITPLQATVSPHFQQQPIEAPPHLANEINIAGLAVFKDGKMVGTLTGPQARGAVWVFGDSRASYSLPSPRDARHSVGILTLDSDTTITPTFRDGKLHIEIHLDVVTEMIESGKLDPRFTEESVSLFEQAFARSIAGEIRETMDKLQNVLGADIFGIRKLIYRRSPKTWKAIEDRWDEVYESAEVDIQVDVRIIGPGLVRLLSE